MRRELLVVVVLTVMVTAPFGLTRVGAAEEGIISPYLSPKAAQPLTQKVIHDGVISAGEYSEKILVDSASSFYLHYAINGTTIYFAYEGNVKGYLSIGFGYSTAMQDADIYIGYVDGTGGHVSDNWGTGTISHTVDTTQNVLSYAGSENSTSTVIEFSRLLDTGDASQDNVIPLGSSMNLIWAYSNTADDFSTYHDARGYATATFSKTGPSQPFNLKVSPGDSQATLTWDAAIDGGDPITGYTIYQSSTQGGPYSQVTSGVSSPYTVTGLTNAQTYYFVVTATNGIGEGAQSNEVSVTPSGTVTEPLNVNATAGRSQVDLTWDPPVSNGGSPITGYNVYRSQVTGGPYSFIGSNTTTTGYSDTTVVNGLTYYYVVTAKNAFKESVYSSEVSAVPKGESEPPENITTFLTANETIIVNWTAPYTDGGYPIVEYKIYRSSTSGGPYTLLGSNQTAFGFEDDTVVNMETYYYVVSAVNSFGESKMSEESRIKVAKVPFAPAITSIVAGFNYVNVSWSEPDDNGYSIMYYNVYRALSESGPYSFISNVSTLFYLDTLVANQEYYYYKVAAVNSQGEGKLSAVKSTLVGRNPDPPTSLVGEIADSEVSLSWDAPVIDGGFPISNFSIYRSNGTNSSYAKIATTNETSYVDSDVTNGVLYFYRVTATNSLGESKMSAEIKVRPGVVPSAPLNLTSVYSSDKVFLSWTAPQDTSNYEVLNYLIYRSSDGGTVYLFVGNSSTTSYVDSSVLAGVEYYYRVSAITALGEGELSNSTSVKAVTVPERPLNLVGYVSGNSAVLQWSPPIFDGGSPVTHFNIYVLNYTTDEYLLLGNSTGGEYVVANLTYGENYTFVVTSVNDFGESGYSSPLVLIIDPPVIQKASVVTWFLEAFKDVFYTSAIFIGFGIIGATTAAITRLPKPEV